jgi:hypothetical protein
MTDVAVPLAEEVSPHAVSAREASFPELVWAHFLWERDLHSGVPVQPQIEQRYRDALANFERDHGEIVDSYWSTVSASAVALTVNRPRSLLRWIGVEPRIEFHRETDWVTKHAPQTAETLQRCELLAIRASEILRGTPERIAMRRLHAVASHLLGFVDRFDGRPAPEPERIFTTAQEQELRRIDSYYRRAAANAGRLVYFSGMMYGALAVAVLGVLMAVVLGGLGATETTLKTFFACYAAGSVGAIVSVMSRMSSNEKFTIEYDVGRTPLRWLGSFRPVLGAVFGVAAYYLLQSDILRTDPPDGNARFFYYGILAFVAGFSERTAKVIREAAERQFGPEDRGQPAPDERGRRATEA